MTRNKFENAIGKQLSKAKARFAYESEKIPYCIEGKYLPDFVIETPNGKLYLECKGFFRREHKTKMAAVKRCNPSLDIRIVFYRKDKTNIRWAEKHGFRYAFHTIPDLWLEGH